MKKMNNKGVTLMELLVSIAMLSAAMALMYSMMANLQNKKKNLDIRSADLLKIADMENNIEKAIMGPVDYGRDKLSCLTITSGVNSRTITMKKNDTTYNYTIKSTNNVIELSGSYNYKWTLSNGKKCSLQSNNYQSISDKKTGFMIIILCEDENSRKTDYIKLPFLFGVKNKQC